MADGGELREETSADDLLALETGRVEHLVETLSPERVRKLCLVYWERIQAIREALRRGAMELSHCQECRQPFAHRLGGGASCAACEARRKEEEREVDGVSTELRLWYSAYELLAQERGVWWVATGNPLDYQESYADYTPEEFLDEELDAAANT